MHGLYRGLILEEDGLHGPAPFVYIPFDPPAQPDVGVCVHKNFNIHLVSQGFVFKNQDALHHNHTFGLQEHNLVAAVMDGKIVHRALYRPSCPEFFQVPDHQLRLKCRRFVVIELAARLIGQIVVRPIVIVVT